ncbi:hypothetical protein SM438_20940 [Salmonella enterica]|nr:hypothetical protein [Salmonella enterica]MEA1704862.1 hypothetical protein [Salmonella enterica subsp. enterica serovar Minnesota]MDX9555270.1 hypothetical protein [Salmonella enterica]MDX9564494.1 hypothetical protein [Salmonella enterica]MDX9569083.1 hypothetical protein [Salmonella enterica]
MEDMLKTVREHFPTRTVVIEQSLDMSGIKRNEDGTLLFPRRTDKRFPIARIEWLLKQGRQLGVSAKLASKLNYLWRSCTGELAELNDLFRLTCALETAKDMHWNYRLLSDREWSGRYAVSLNAGVNGVYLSRANNIAGYWRQLNLVNEG